MPFNYNIKYGNTEIFTSSAPLENIPIKYNDNTIATLSTESTIILSTKDKYAQGNIQIGDAILPCGGKSAQ